MQRSDRIVPKVGPIHGEVTNLYSLISIWTPFALAPIWKKKVGDWGIGHWWFQKNTLWAKGYFATRPRHATRGAKWKSTRRSTETSNQKYSQSVGKLHENSWMWRFVKKFEIETQNWFHKKSCLPTWNWSKIAHRVEKMQNISLKQKLGNKEIRTHTYRQFHKIVRKMRCELKVTVIHTVEFAEIYCHSFFTKLSSNQRFTKEPYCKLIWQNFSFLHIVRWSHCALFGKIKNLPSLAEKQACKTGRDHVKVEVC